MPTAPVGPRPASSGRVFWELGFGAPAAAGGLQSRAEEAAVSGPVVRWSFVSGARLADTRLLSRG